ncbi:MAG TPA: hypothetical protein VFE05_19130 [Longimicrobiaceae bacterium]|nr:hypothetical protein [Longimicrobiaceae bacterium]
MAEHARARTYCVECVPAGWAVVDPAGERRWTLAREESARGYATGANAARTPAELHRTLAALHAEISPEWYQLALRRRAADALLDAAAGHAFVDALRATDAVRWAHLRHHPLAGILAAGPSAFGTLRVQADEPALWAALPEPRHEQVPAWLRFRETAETWVAVQEGQPWAVPSTLPPPPPSPSLPRSAEAIGRAAPLPEGWDAPALGGFAVPRVQRGLDL